MKKHVVHSRKSCRICLEETLVNVFSLKPTPVSDDYTETPQEMQKFPLNLMLCPTCAHLQLEHVVAAEGIYEENIYWTKSSPGLKEHFRDYAFSVKQKVSLNEGLFVDIGCNDGMLLSEFKALGFRVCGVEPAKNISKYLKDQKLDVVNDYFSKAVAKKIVDECGTASIITTNNTFANIDDLHEFLEAVIPLLSPDGYFIVEAAHAQAMFKTMVFDNIYHEHLNYFSLHSLEKLCNAHDLKLVFFEKVDTKGGSMRAYFKRTEQAKSVDEVVTRTLREETEIGVHLPETYHRFYEEVNAIGQALRNRLIALKQAGKRVVGYGASSTVTTVLHHYEIGDLLEYLVDDNPIKQGKFSPGYNLEVHPSTYLMKDHPDVVLIIPWRFEDMIIERNLDYLKSGGTFLKFMPKLIEVASDYAG